MNRLTVLSTQQSFLDMLKLDKAIAYLLVDWSGPERASRHNIYSAFDEPGQIEVPAFIIDCSYSVNGYVDTWLIRQREIKSDFNCGGMGETLLIEKGSIIDFIKYPAQLGLERTKEKLKEWCDKSLV